MATLSTHALDTALGRPAEGLGVRLAALAPDGQWLPVSQGATDADGRIGKVALAPDGLAPGTYQITFDTGTYLARVHGGGFYPYVPIVFEITADQHYHVPLLLSPYGISTYRGS